MYMYRCVLGTVYCAIFMTNAFAAAKAADPVVEDTATAATVVEAAAPQDMAPTTAALPSVLELADCQRIALDQNPTLQAASARIEQAKARVKQARSLYSPQIAASYAAAHTELANSVVDDARRQTTSGLGRSILQSASGLLFGGGDTGVPVVASLAITVVQSGFQAIQARNAIPDDADSYNASVVASYLVFDGFARKFTRLAALYGTREVQAAHLEAQRLLLDAVAQSFHGVQLARENIAIAEADVAFNERLLKEAEIRREVGAGALSDVLNFEVRLRAARTAMLQSQNDLEQARIALAVLMGLPDAALPDGVAIAPLSAETPEEMAQPETEAAIGQALDYRPDLQQSEFQVRRTKATVGQRRGSYYPTVSASVSRDASSTRSGGFETDDFGTTVGINVSYDIFVGGRRKAEVLEARSAQKEAEWLQEDARLNVIADVRQALADLRTAQDQLVLQRTTTEYVERNRDLVEKEYDAGQAALVRLNEAQRDLIEAQGRLALARVSLRQAWHTFHTATAETLSWFPKDGEGE